VLLADCWISTVSIRFLRFADCCEETKNEEAIKANVMLQLEHLMEYTYVKAAVDKGDLELHGMVYDFGSGKVEYLTDDAV